MRRPFFKQLHAAMAADERIVFCTGDLGYSLVEPLQRDFPGRCINMQAAEFAMVGAAIGMTYAGMIPLVYSITPFIVYRPFELLRTYVNHECPPVKLVGAGRDMDYRHEGISHHAHDVKPHLDLFPNIAQFWPADEAELTATLSDYLYNDKPSFLSLSK